jgi:transcriptional regulator with XRE-family HTH domain
VDSQFIQFHLKYNKLFSYSSLLLAEKVDTSTHYMGMIESEKKFPTPEMLERIAAALEIDAPVLFSTKSYQPVALVDFLRLMPQKIPDCRAAYAVCRVKNRLKADFLGSCARNATNCYPKPDAGTLADFQERVINHIPRYLPTG